MQASAKTLAFLLLMQNTSTDLMCFYDGGLGFSDYNALINPDTGAPYRTYYALALFGDLYRLGSEVATECGDGLFALAAREGRRLTLAIANPSEEDRLAEISVAHFPTEVAAVHRIDRDHRFTKTGEAFADGRISVPAFGCVEIELWDLR